MSGKLDQSLDEIMKDRKPVGKGARRSGRLPNRKAATKSQAATAAVIAPAGGIQKKTKATKPTRSVVPSAPVTGDSKITVSNLPEDVSEVMIKEYFSSAVAPVKRVILNYGPNGRSRGSATVSFGKPTAAQESTKLDGLKVEGKPMRIEVLVGAKNVPPPQAPKGLADRVQPKNAAQEQKKQKAKKEGVAKGTSAVGATTNGDAKGKKKRSGRVGRPKPKTADELDAEMQDYFGGDAGAVANGAAAAGAVTTNGGDTGMADEVM